MAGQVCVEGRVKKERVSRIGSPTRNQVLCTELRVPLNTISEAPREREDLVVALCVWARKLGVVEIGADAGVTDLGPGQAVHLVQRVSAVARLVTVTKRRIELNVTNRLDAYANADSLI